MTLAEPFRAALEADRAELNQRFKLCSSQGAPLDAGAFQAHLVARVQPIVLAVAELFPERARLATKELVTVSLELFRASFWGTESKLPQLNQLWEQTLPKLGHLVAREPERVSGSLSNALINLAKYPVRVDQWLEDLARMGARCQSVAELLQVGQVLAWRAGLTLLRSRVLETLTQLPRELACPALGLTETADDPAWSAILERLTRDRWYEPTQGVDDNRGAQIREACRVGDYRGLGGGFSDLPKVFMREDQLYVTDGTTVWRIDVDRYGCILQPVPVPPPTGHPKKSRSPALDGHGRVHWESDQQSFPYLKAANSHATDGQTLAVTLENSFHVYLLCRSAA